MSQQAQIEALQEQADDLVGYVQDYQQRLVAAEFQTVQANNTARKLQNKLDQAEQALRDANARITELEPVERQADPATLLEDVEAATSESPEPTKRAPRGK
jgi:chromosome segregation ATPase